jgi:outer membrane protein TolC
MKGLFFVLALPTMVFAQAIDTLDLNQLVHEALRNNPGLKAADYNREVMEERANQAGALDDPQLQYMREEMPGFRWNEAMYSRIELMQMFRFPGKLSTQEDIADIEAEHAHHDLMEKVNDVLVSLRMAYFDLWFSQQSLALNGENRNLLQQFAKIAQTRYVVGDVARQDVLKAQVELARLENQVAILRQQERSAQAMLVALLNRPLGDTLGVAVVDQESVTLPALDTLQQLALQFRPMLWHDSLSVEENREMLSLAKAEFLPDFTLGIEYVTTPISDFTGWSVRAGITLPFAPWTLLKANSRVEEASISITMAQETLNNSRNMVLLNVSDLYFKAQSVKEQLTNYSQAIIPQSRQALQSSLLAYQTGRTDFLMLIDSYRTLVELSMEELMLRMQFEQTIAELKRTIGYAGIFDPENERN